MQMQLFWGLLPNFFLHLSIRVNFGKMKNDKKSVIRDNNREGTYVYISDFYTKYHFTLKIESIQFLGSNETYFYVEVGVNDFTLKHSFKPEQSFYRSPDYSILHVVLISLN